MEILSSAFEWIMSLNSTVFITLMFFIITFAVGGGFQKSIRSALYFGGGLVGVTTIMNIAVNIMAPVASGVSERLGIEKSIVDVGYGVHPSTLSWPGAFIIFFVIFGISFLLVSLKVLNTVLTDPHNVWHGIWFGAVAWSLTGNLWFAVILSIIFLVGFLFLADFHAKRLQESTGVENITFISCAVTIPLTFACLCMKVIEKIPGLKDLDVEVDDVKEKFGVFGETVTIGFVVGLIFSLIAGFSVTESLYNAIALGASLALFPRLAGFLLEGIVPMTTAITVFMKKKFPGRHINVTVDVAVLLGDPSVMTCYCLVVPTIIILSLILPGVGFIPIASLSSAAYFIGSMVPATKGNVVHTMIVSLLWFVIMMYVGTWAAEAVTATSEMGGFFLDQIEQGTLFTCWDEGSNPLMLLVTWLSGMFS